jgi:site-specific recombinase
MALFNRKNRSAPTASVADVPVIKIDSIYRGLDYLVEFVKQIRPAHHNDFAEAELKFKAMFYQLQHDRVLLFSVRKALLTQFENSTIIPALTESGMVKARGFIQEMVTKIKHKLLPSLQQSDDFLFVINHVFYHPKDHIWVEGIDRRLWINFFKLLGFNIDVTEPAIIRELNKALYILSRRVVTLSLEKDIIDNSPVKDYHQYPFVRLDFVVQQYLQLFEDNAGPLQLDQYIQRINLALYDCRGLINDISEHRKEHGTSLSQTYILFRIEQHIERLLLITDALDHDIEFNADHFLSYFIRIIYYEKRKNSLREFISANFAFIAYKITEHGGKRGEGYITATRTQFWKMITSAMGGGFIISFIAVIKNLLHKVPLPPFWQGFAYSVNYAFGFQLMHETNTTLATKQPAYTASTIASSLNVEKNKTHPDMHGLAITVARASRSQLASFFGNLVVVFPLTFGLAALYHYATGSYLLNAKEAHQTLLDQHPLKSFSILYACFTGFFLFASGLIAGYVENGINYGKVGERIRFHPVFKNTLSSKRLQKVTSYVENNFGALIGNISLGFFLGMAGFFGTIFGIPFDIRHITIAAGNSAIAFYSNGTNEDAAFLWTVFAGVLLIGLFNFIVSFSLAFFVAVKSRGVRLRDYPELFGIIARFFYHYPKDFFYPPTRPRQVEDVKQRLYHKS